MVLYQMKCADDGFSSLFHNVGDKIIHHDAFDSEVDELGMQDNDENLRASRPYSNSLNSTS
jgi:hypothetical protein